MATKHHGTLDIVKTSGRPGEGVVLEVTRKMLPRPDGTSGFQIGIDLGNAPVPERRYAADAANVNYNNGQIYLIFWQKKISGTDARSMVVLTLASVAALQFLQNSSEQIAQLEKNNSVKLQGSLEELPEEPAQTVCLAANLIAAGWSGRESCMDFYYASPFVVAALPKSGKFAAEPMVRVSLPTGVLVAVWHKIESFRGLFPKDELDSLAKFV